ncbi:MAG: protein glxC [Alphaproteobacteria bacterium]|nr:protein glxC [Alphaproteobacteria bacterium]
MGRQRVTVETIDLDAAGVRALNRRLQGRDGPVAGRRFTVTNAKGRHALAAGLTDEVDVLIQGHVGYYCAGMNRLAGVTVEGNAGTGVAENLMSGTVRVTGDASQSAGASGRGGLLVIEGSASARCGITMKGIDIVVGGSIGHMSAFMAQAGRLVVCGDAGAYLGDSIYEAEIYVRGRVESLGADCVEKELSAEDARGLEALLARAGMDGEAAQFRCYGSARRLYNFHIDNAAAY